MSQTLNNPTSGTHRDYGATSNVTPEVSFAASSSGNAGFSPTEFVSLSQSVGDNITAIKSSTRQLEKHLKIIATAKDQKALRDKIHAINTKTNVKVQTTSEDLQRLQAVIRHGDRQQKLQLDKLTSEFQEVVRKYSMQQKRILLATQQTYQAAANAEHEAEMTAGSQLLEQEQEELQQQQANLIERQRQMQQLEADVLDINLIMNKLNTMVHEQGTMVDTIENTVEETASNVEEGRAELQKAAASRNSYRRKILILLVIAVIIGLVVTGIIVAKLNK